MGSTVVRMLGEGSDDLSVTSDTAFLLIAI